MDSGNEPLQGRFITLNLHRHPGGAVPDPAGEAEAAGEPVDEGAKADPLDDAGDIDTKARDSNTSGNFRDGCPRPYSFRRSQSYQSAMPAPLLAES